MIITLLTDFGADSGYVGQVKGVLLSNAPSANLVDLSHSVPPFDVISGALLLEECVGAFPRGTVHLAVVDPGVGGERRALAMRWQDHFFVGPDNGLFEPFLERAETEAVRVITRESIQRQPVADTFHARDVFAPAAAWLANGWSLPQLGAVVSDPVRLAWPATMHESKRVRAPLLRVDPFGNLQARLRREDVPVPAEALPKVRASVGMGHGPGEPFRSLGTLKRFYAEARPGELMALWGSSGRLEVAQVQGSAEKTLGHTRERPAWVSLEWD
jgi:S-adenosylmethionine hydrolase